jgi:hypothetical protein
LIVKVFSEGRIREGTLFELVLQLKGVMPNLFRHPHAAMFDVYPMWIPGQARNDGLYSLLGKQL